MKRVLLNIMLACLPVMASAYDAEVNGIYYNLIVKAKQAEVTSGESKYNDYVTIPESVTYEGVTYSVTAIASKAFYYCSDLTSVIIPNSVTSIGDYAFASCSGLTSVVIPNNVTSIGDHAFYRCSSLTSVTIGNSVTHIDREAFDDCYKLASVHITDITAWCKIDFWDYRSNPLRYAKHLFINGKKVTNLVIPDSVTSLGSYVFWGYSDLKSVTIPNSVISIGGSAFRDCTGLTSLTIPNSVTSIGNDTFWGCSDLKSVTIPNSVISIGGNAFRDCFSLTEVTIPNSVKEIGYYAFYGCSSLTEVTIPNSVTKIEIYTFYGCSGLTEVTIPNSVKEIGHYAFEDCLGLTSVIIGNNLKSIGMDAFKKCPKLETVYCKAEIVPNSSSEAFNESYIEYATLYVPINAIEAYRSATPWSAFGTIKALDGEIPEVKKCDTPTISYNDGQITFSCDTEDVDFISEITDTDIKKHYDAEIQLSATYHISVYATKTGYDNSNVAEATLCWMDGSFEMEGTTIDVIKTNATPFLIKSKDGLLSVEGLPDGTRVSIYTTAGTQVCTSVSSNGIAIVDTELPSGTIAIIKAGENSVKITIK